MANSKHVILIEDEPAIRDGLQNLFVFHGYRVSAFSDGLTGLSAALGENAHLVILDVMLPGKNGFDVCQEIRLAKPTLPIIMLTAKTSEDDIINGLKLGADDYIPKPFSLRILLTKAESLIRRESRGLENETLLVGNWRISGRNLEAIDIENKTKVELTSREIEILQFLVSRGGDSKTREELLSNVWGYRDASDIETRTVDIHIAKLRKKIERDPKNPTCILTVRGRGYRLVQNNET
jgi:DNA-binding response OmpR family regulator